MMTDRRPAASGLLTLALTLALAAGSTAAQETDDLAAYAGARADLEGRYLDAHRAGDVEAKLAILAEMEALTYVAPAPADGRPAAVDEAGDGEVEPAAGRLVALGLPLLEALGPVRRVANLSDLGRTYGEIAGALADLLAGLEDADGARILVDHRIDFEGWAADWPVLGGDPVEPTAYEVADLQERIDALRDDLAAVVEPAGADALAERVRRLGQAFAALEARMRQVESDLGRLPETLSLEVYGRAVEASGLSPAVFHAYASNHYAGWRRPVIPDHAEVEVTILGRTRTWAFGDFCDWLRELDESVHVAPDLAAGHYRRLFLWAFPGQAEELFQSLRRRPIGDVGRADEWAKLFGGGHADSGDDYAFMASGRPIEWIEVDFRDALASTVIAVDADKRYPILIHGPRRYRTARDLAEIERVVRSAAEASAQIAGALLGGVASLPATATAKTLFAFDVGIQSVDGILNVLDEQELRRVTAGLSAVRNLLDIGATFRDGADLAATLDALGKGAASIGDGLVAIEGSAGPEARVVQAILSGAAASGAR